LFAIKVSIFYVLDMLRDGRELCIKLTRLPSNTRIITQLTPTSSYAFTELYSSFLVEDNIFKMLSTLLTLGAVSAGISVVGAQTTSGLPITGLLGNAPKLTNNTVGVLYTATLPTTGSIQGFLSAYSANGTGVQLASSFSGLPSTGGYFRKFCIRR
jgi:hypothetical protein